MYGISIWGATYSIYLQKLKSLLNRAIRAVVGARFRDLVNPYYSQLKILQIDDLFKFEVAKFVNGSLHNKAPNSFSKYFCKTNDRSSRATRQSSNCNNLNIPRYGTNKLQWWIKYQGVRIRNRISINIRAFSQKKNSNITTKTFYYFRTNINIKDFDYTVCIFLHDIIKQMSAALVT